MRLHLFSTETLRDELAWAGIEHVTRTPQPGSIQNSAGEVVDLVKFSVPVLAAVLIAWLKYRPTRRLIVTTKDQTVVHVEGMSVAEVEKLLEVATSAMLIDMQGKNRKEAIGADKTGG